MQTDAQSWPPDRGDPIEDRPAGSFAWLGRSHTIFALIGLYLIGHFVLRLLLSPTLGMDDAEQILFAQQWALGYRFRQPPLFTWLLLPVVEVVGPGVLAVSLVRYGLLAFTFVFLYLTARLCIDDRRLAGLAVLSFPLIYVFAYYAHHDLTHTTALGATIAVSFYAMARLARKPDWTAYLVLGLAFGFGLLAKWNFVMLAIGLPLTCLLMPAYRHLVVTPKIVTAIGTAAVVSAPTALWMFDNGQSIQGVSSAILADGEPGPAVWLDGTVALLRSVLLFPLPFLPIFLILFGGSLRSRASSPPPREKPALPPAFFGSLILIVLGLHLLLIPVFGAVEFTERWMHPALMSLPIVLFALAARTRPPERSITAFVTIAAILVAVAAGARLYRYVDGADHCGQCREFAPFAELADGLRQTGFAGGTIVADGMHIGGNLKMHFAGSRVVDPAFPRTLWPDADSPGDCLLVWRDDAHSSSSSRERLRRYAAAEFGLSTTVSPETGRLEAPLLRSSNRRYALGFEHYREKDGGCR